MVGVYIVPYAQVGGLVEASSLVSVQVSNLNHFARLGDIVVGGDGDITHLGSTAHF